MSNNLINPFKKLNISKYGFVFFNKNKDEPIKNWKCYYSIGGEKAQLVKSYIELPKDIIWWTNLNKLESWEMGKFSKFKSSDFLGINYNIVLNYFLLDSDKITEMVKKNSQFFSNFMYILSNYLKKININIFNYNLNGSLKDFIATLSFKDNENEMINKFCNNFLLSEVEVLNKNELLDLQSDPNYENIYVNLPVYNNINNILLENNNYTTVKKIELPISIKKENYIFDENNVKKPILMNISNISIIKEENKVRTLLGQRCLTLNGSFINNIWLTNEEFYIINDYIKCEINNMYLCVDSSYNFNEYVLKDNQDNDLKGYSLNFNLLTSLFLSIYFDNSYNFDNRRKNKKSLSNILITAKERIKYFNIVSKLLENNIKIVSYGNSSIRLIYKKDEIEKVLLTCLELGIKIPLRYINKLTNLNNITNKEFLLNKFYINEKKSCLYLDIDNVYLNNENIDNVLLKNNIFNFNENLKLLINNRSK